MTSSLKMIEEFVANRPPKSFQYGVIRSVVLSGGKVFAAVELWLGDGRRIFYIDDQLARSTEWAVARAGDRVEIGADWFNSEQLNKPIMSICWPASRRRWDENSSAISEGAPLVEKGKVIRHSVVDGVAYLAIELTDASGEKHTICFSSQWSGVSSAKLAVAREGMDVTVSYYVGAMHFGIRVVGLELAWEPGPAFWGLDR